METQCFWAVTDNTLAVLLDLPVELQIDRLETTELLRSDGSREKVHLVHFRSSLPQWRGEIDLTYHIRPREDATSLHSVGYSSTNSDQEGSDGAAPEDARGAAR